ncbi:hypothetical protein GF362_06615 [Candidatus Dojkabacteria bacterium]|nr:hypothetical protein [Candidatus Dojkabacteria bacterium]
MSDKQLLKNIRKVTPKFCDNCGQRYTPDSFKILKAADNSALIHLNCSKCGNTYVINAFTNNVGVGSQRMPLVLDLKDAKEVEKFANMPPISKDDAIDFFNFLDEDIIFGKMFPDLKVKNTKDSKNQGVGSS